MMSQFLPALSRNKHTILGNKALLGRCISIRRGFSASPQEASPDIGIDAFQSFNSAKFTSLDEEINDANTRYKNLVRIQTIPNSPIGRGVTSSRSFTKGDTIVHANAIASHVPQDSHTLQKNWNEHFFIDLPARFINHSCHGNVGVRDNDVGAYDFVALDDIGEGEELKWDYEATEYDIVGFPRCKCGHVKCRGEIGGFQKNGDVVKRQYGEYIANYLK